MQAQSLSQMSTNLPVPSQIFEITEVPKSIILKIKITEHASKIMNDSLKDLNFESVKEKGKYNSLKFSYCREQANISVTINKYYYLNVLNMKKYQVLLFSRCYQSNFQQFLNLMSQIMSRFIKPNDCRLIKFDVFSLTISKEFRFINSRNQQEVKKLFLKMSPFYFRRNPFVRTKECEQYFAAILKSYSPLDEPPATPTQEQFFNSPRVSFIDDVYSNDSFAKRFCPRFLLFYQAYSLFAGEASLEHRYVKQFYMKCASKCAMNTLRLKKISFNFFFPLIETNKRLKLVLYLYCVEEERESAQSALKQRGEESSFSKLFKQKITSFTLEMMIEEDSLHQRAQHQHQHQNPQNLQQVFLKHLVESIPIGQDCPFVELGGTTARTFKIYNEVGFAWILCMLCFFIDRIIFKNINSKIGMQNQYPNNYKDTTMLYKLPFSQEFKLKKYANNYCVEIKSAYNYGQVLNSSLLKQQQKPRSAYENSINRIIMVRKKVAKESTEYFQFQPSSADQLKGLTIYVNELLRKWNVCDCYYDINSFVANYLNIIVDKNKEKNEKNLYKNVGLWKQVIDGLSALVQVLVRSMCTSDTTVVLQILRTYEDFRRNEELLRSEINEGEEVMLMTFKFMKITIGGWVELIPSCVYYLEMVRDQTYLYMDGEAKREEMGIKFKKEQIEKTLKSYIKRTSKTKFQLPPFFYKP